MIVDPAKKTLGTPEDDGMPRGDPPPLGRRRRPKMFTETRTAGTAVDAAVSPATPAVPMALKDGTPANEKPKILEDVVIEEVSIDGMCGVY